MNPKIAWLLTQLGVKGRFDSDEAALDAACNAVEKMSEQDEKDEKDRSDAADAAQAQIDAEKARADGEKARADRADARVKELEAAEKARADAAERAELDTIAKGVGIDSTKHADSKALKRAIAAHKLGGELKADATDAYVQVLVDMVKTDLAKRGDGADPADGGGRAAGSSAWSQPGDNRGDAGGSGGTGGDPPAQKKEYVSPTQRARQRADAAFKKARSGK